MGRGTAWLPYAGFLLAIAGIVYQAGQLTASNENNSARISRLEATDQARSDALVSINVRTARIEAKLDFLLPPPKERAE